jgi:hypothetical protein
MKVESLDGYMPLRQYAKKSNYHPNTILKQIKNGKLNAVRLGRFWFIKQ